MKFIQAIFLSSFIFSLNSFSAEQDYIAESCLNQSRAIYAMAESKLQGKDRLQSIVSAKLSLKKAGLRNNDFGVMNNEWFNDAFKIIEKTELNPDGAQELARRYLGSCLFDNNEIVEENHPAASATGKTKRLTPSGKCLYQAQIVSMVADIKFQSQLSTQAPDAGIKNNQPKDALASTINFLEKENIPLNAKDGVSVEWIKQTINSTYKQRIFDASQPSYMYRAYYDQCIYDLNSQQYEYLK